MCVRGSKGFWVKKRKKKEEIEGRLETHRECECERDEYVYLR